LVAFTVLLSNEDTDSGEDYDSAKKYLSDGTPNATELAEALEQPSVVNAGGSAPSEGVFEEPQVNLDESGKLAVFHSRGQGDAGICFATPDQATHHLKGTDENDFSHVINGEGTVIAHREGDNPVIKKFSDILSDQSTFKAFRVKEAVDRQNSDSGHSRILALDGGTLAYSEGSTVHIWDKSSIPGGEQSG
jgi:hypothetical protein